MHSCPPMLVHVWEPSPAQVQVVPLPAQPLSVQSETDAPATVDAWHFCRHEGSTGKDPAVHSCPPALVHVWEPSAAQVQVVPLLTKPVSVQ